MHAIISKPGTKKKRKSKTHRQLFWLRTNLLLLEPYQYSSYIVYACFRTNLTPGRRNDRLIDCDCQLGSFLIKTADVQGAWAPARDRENASGTFKKCVVSSKKSRFFSWKRAPFSPGINLAAPMVETERKTRDFSNYLIESICSSNFRMHGIGDRGKSEYTLAIPQKIKNINQRYLRLTILHRHVLVSRTPSKRVHILRKCKTRHMATSV